MPTPRGARRRSSGTAAARWSSARTADPQPPPSGSLADVGTWLYEPDRALLRAGLVGAVTAATGGQARLRGGHVSAGARGLPFARRYAVVEAMPFNVKALRGWLRDRQVDRLTIKKRGVSLDADLLRRQLRMPPKGHNEALVVISRVRSQQVVLVVQPA